MEIHCASSIGEMLLAFRWWKKGSKLGMIMRGVKLPRSLCRDSRKRIRCGSSKLPSRSVGQGRHSALMIADHFQPLNCFPLHLHKSTVRPENDAIEVAASVTLLGGALCTNFQLVPTATNSSKFEHPYAIYRGDISELPPGRFQATGLQ